VLLYDDPTVPLSASRLFSLYVRPGLWMGNEHGHQVWLTETKMPGVLNFFKRVDARQAAAKSIITPRPRSTPRRRKK